MLLPLTLPCAHSLPPLSIVQIVVHDGTAPGGAICMTICGNPVVWMLTDHAPELSVVQVVPSQVAFVVMTFVPAAAATIEPTVASMIKCVPAPAEACSFLLPSRMFRLRATDRSRLTIASWATVMLVGSSVATPLPGE